MQSLAGAGWPDTHVFAEPGSQLPTQFEPGWITIHQRPDFLYAWANWIESLEELLAEDPAAEAILLCQDDVIFWPHLRAYLEDTLWPGTKAGICSAYRPGSWPSKKGRNWVGWQPENRGLHLVGALCWALPRRHAETIVADRRKIERAFLIEMGKDDEARIDVKIGIWAKAAGREIYYHVPSLAQHTGLRHSTLGDRVAGPIRQATDYLVDQKNPPPAVRALMARYDEKSLNP